MFFKNLPNFFYPFFIDFLFKYHLFLFLVNSISTFSVCCPYRSFFKVKYLLSLSGYKLPFFEFFSLFSFNLRLKFQKKLRLNAFLLEPVFIGSSVLNFTLWTSGF